MDKREEMTTEGYEGTFVAVEIVLIMFVVTLLNTFTKSH